MIYQLYIPNFFYSYCVKLYSNKMIDLESIDTRVLGNDIHSIIGSLNAFHFLGNNRHHEMIFLNVSLELNYDKSDKHFRLTQVYS